MGRLRMHKTTNRHLIERAEKLVTIMTSRTDSAAEASADEALLRLAQIKRCSPCCLLRLRATSTI
jgi:hypothetical protein